jgi:hypothetical protein
VTEEGQRLCYGYLAAQPRRPKGRSCAECGWRPTVALKADKAGVVAPVCLFCERAKSSELDFAKQRMLL